MEQTEIEAIISYIKSKGSKIESLFIFNRMVKITFVDRTQPPNILGIDPKQVTDLESQILRRFNRRSINFDGERKNLDAIILNEFEAIEKFITSETDLSAGKRIFRIKINVGKQERDHMQLTSEDCSILKKPLTNPHLSPSLSYGYKCKQNNVEKFSYMLRCYHENDENLNKEEKEIIGEMLKSTSSVVKVLSLNGYLISVLDVNYGVDKTFSELANADPKNYKTCIQELLFISFYCTHTLANGTHVMVDESSECRTNAAVCSLTKIISNYTYRTVASLINLIKTDWLNYGYSFDDSSIVKLFEIWLLAIKCLVLKYPDCFEYESVLIDDIRDELSKKIYYPFSNIEPNIDVLESLKLQALNNDQFTDKSSLLLNLTTIYDPQLKKTFIKEKEKRIKIDPDMDDLTKNAIIYTPKRERCTIL